MSNGGRRKIAILGGGCGAVAAAYCLTRAPDWRDRFEVTIYQMGWRLGGKGASGRNEQKSNRIEEHGLHVWGGFYQNAFAMMRGVYHELGRSPGTPLSRLFDINTTPSGGIPQGAFKPQRNVVLMEWIQEGAAGRWMPWCIEFPADPYTWLDRGATGFVPVPGDDGALPNAFSVIQLLASYAYEDIRAHLTDPELLPTGLDAADLPATLDEGLKAELLKWRPPEVQKQLPSSRQIDFEDNLTGLVTAVVTRTLDMHGPPPGFAEGSVLDFAGRVLSNYEWPSTDSPEEAAAEFALQSMKRLTLATALAQVLRESDLRESLPKNGQLDDPPRVLIELEANLADAALLFAAGAAWRWEELSSTRGENELALRRTGQLLELASAIVSGMVIDGIWLFGFEHVDHMEFREWLQRHGVREETCKSVCVMAAYDYTFAYQQGFVGDIDSPGNSPRGSDENAKIAAGTALKGTLQLIFGYRGAIFWEMQAGMGDTVFAPIYDVLKKRGVKFEFFNRIDGLELSDDHCRIERIRVLEQMKVLGGGEYDPIVNVRGLRCWPSEPLYKKLVNGSDLEKRHNTDAIKNNLESIWNSWDEEHATEKTLVRGKDFHDVILAISIGDFPHLCRELINTNDRWRDMVSHIGTNRTFAMQLWLKKTTDELGWPPDGWPDCAKGSHPILTGFAHQLNTWADLSHLIPVEGWTTPLPASLAYFCGPFEDQGSSTIRIERPDHFRKMDTIPGEAYKQAKKLANTWMEKHCVGLWPNHVKRSENLALSDHLDEYIRVNVNPSDLYVLSLPGTTQYRLRADESGFENLYLAGDWVRTELNAGCVECAVMAGFDAAQAIDPAVPRDWLHQVAFLAGRTAGIALSLGAATLRTRARDKTS